MKISTDKRFNKSLKKEVQSLRGTMHSQAEKNPLPEGYTAKACKDSPAFIITAPNGKSTSVPLYAYSDVRKALKELV